MPLLFSTCVRTFLKHHFFPFANRTPAATVAMAAPAYTKADFHEIEEKREFFVKLQPMSEKFLNRLNDTYVGDYIPNKLRLLNANYNDI